MTQKGQVTVPIEIRRKLGLKAKDKVIFEMEDDVVRIKPALKPDFRIGYGAVSSRGEIEDFVTLRDRIEREIAVEVAGET